MSDSELKLALKVNSHRVFVSRFVIFCLFFIDLLIMYNLWYRWVLYSSSTRAAQKEHPTPAFEIDFKGYHGRHQPSPLAISQKGSLISGSNLDHYAIVQNPNTNWQVLTFTIEFRFPNETVRQTITNLIPQETRLMAVYGFPKTSGVSFITTVTNVEWRRVSYSLPDISSTLVIERPRFESNGLVQDYGESVFTVINNSTRGFWDVPYTIKLYTGTQLAGVTNLILANLDPEERREVRTAWNVNPASIDRVEVIIEPWSVINPENRYITRSTPRPSTGLIQPLNNGK